jgi:hypothetical protein
MQQRWKVIRSARWVMLAGLIVLLGLYAAGARGTARGQATGDQAQPQTLRVSFGPELVWSPLTREFQELLNCRRAFSCVADFMLRNGASADAIAFYHLTGWFLDRIKDTGTVQLGTIFTPWRANENTQFALLGGTPAVIFPEEEGGGSGFGVTYNAEFLALKAEHPNILFWASGYRFDGVESTADGGQRFTFAYRLLDGCHLCPILGWANVAFDFAADGTYDGPTLLSVVPELP